MRGSEILGGRRRAGRGAGVVAVAVVRRVGALGRRVEAGLRVAGDLGAEAAGAGRWRWGIFR